MVDVDWQAGLPLVSQPVGFQRGLMQPDGGTIRMINAQDDTTFNVKVGRLQPFRRVVCKLLNIGDIFICYLSIFVALCAIVYNYKYSRDPLSRGLWGPETRPAT